MLIVSAPGVVCGQKKGTKPTMLAVSTGMPDFYHRSIQERDAPLPPTSVFILEGREQYLAAPSYRCHNFSWPGKQNERKMRRGVASGQLTDAEITLPQLQYWRHPPPS